MIGTARRVIRIALGVLLILLGTAGLFLPFLQGIALIAAGILVLAPNSRASQWIRRTFRRSAAWLGQRVRGWKSRPGRKLRPLFKRLAAKLRRKRGQGTKQDA